jgi:hypothetical protein
MKHTTLLTFFLTSLLANANNEIYLEQTGTTGLFNITQVGNSNRIGQSTDVSTIAGNDSVFNISQIGNGNTLDIKWDGGETIFTMYIEGDGNVQDWSIGGTKNIFENTIVGSGNIINISKDDTTSDLGNITSQVLKNFIAGSGNKLDFYLNDNIGAVSDIKISGSGNTVASIQEGGNTGLSHSQIVEVQGDNNNFNLVQSGSVNQTLELTHYGHDTTFNIIQSDGSYTGGLEGLGTISNFDGSYTETFATPEFVQIITP